MWQSRHVFCRLTTIARPRVGSPVVPVSDSGMPSPTILKAGNCWPQAPPIEARGMETTSASKRAILTEYLGCDRAEPTFGISRLKLSDFGRRVDRGRAT